MASHTPPLPAGLLRNLSDRQYEKRKLAALEIETRYPRHAGAPRRAPAARARWSRPEALPRAAIE